MPAQDLRARLGRQVSGLSPFDRRLLLEHPRDNAALLVKIAASLAFVAGAVNAGGFLMVHFYTSHITGTLARVADSAALGNSQDIRDGFCIVTAFLLGAMSTTFLVAYGRRQRFRGKYAFSLAVEAVFLAVFGLSSAALARDPRLVFPEALLLSLIMGMHNAIFTKISHAVVRTTHMTGNLTDFGIELARLLYRNRRQGARLAPVLADRFKLKLHGLLIASFLSGGLAGAFAFQCFGFLAALPLAGFLLLLSFPALLLDLRARLRLRRLSPGR
jgi:uncharacterized membrane protein YoaK (UPF0700 family)